MLRRLLILTIVISLLIQNFSRVGVLAHFYLNQKTITEKYCVNKARVKLHCNGKCFLAKKLRKADADEKNQTERLLKQDTVHMFYQSGYYFSFKTISQLLPVLLCRYYLPLHIPDFYQQIFAPPQ